MSAWGVERRQRRALSGTKTSPRRTGAVWTASRPPARVATPPIVELLIKAPAGNDEHFPALKAAPRGTRRGLRQSPSAAFRAVPTAGSTVHCLDGRWCSAAQDTVTAWLPASSSSSAPKRSWVR